MKTIIFGLAAFVALWCAALSAVAASTSWHFTGTINAPVRNEIGFPVPVGERVEIDITFGTVPTDPNPLEVGDYLFSDGLNRFQVRIGDHVSTPITQFRLTAIIANCCASNDQYNFLSYESQGNLLDIDFPGFLEGDVSTQLFFRRRHTPGPITDASFPVVQPDPSAFEDARITFWKNRTSTRDLVFSANLNPIPEPNSALLGAVAWPTAWLIRRRNFRR